MNEQIQRFLQAIEDLREDYKAIEVRTVAFRWNSQWLNLSTRATFSTRRFRKFSFEIAPPNFPELLVDGDFLPPAELDRLLEIFEAGTLRWRDTDISFQRVDGSGLGAPYHPFFSTYERGRSRDWLGLDAHCYTLSGAEGTIQNSIGHDGFKMLESKLASLETPFDGLADFVRAYTGYDRLQNSWSYINCRVARHVAA